MMRSLSADQGNSHSKNNLQGLTDDLQGRGEAVSQFANSPVSDAAMAQAQRWANIQDLHRRINEVEADALHQDASSTSPNIPAMQRTGPVPSGCKSQACVVPS